MSSTRDVDAPWNSSVRSPRWLLRFKEEEDGVAKVVARLADDRKDGWEDRMTDNLRFIAWAAHVDPFFSLELGTAGGFAHLIGSQQTKLSLSILDDELQLSMVECVSAICAGGLCSSFPSVPFTDPSFLKPLYYEFVSDTTGERFGVWLRRWPQHVGPQANVGFIPWTSSLIQARWLSTHHSTWLKSGEERVLELGAGIGLSGIVASHFSKHVTLTDFNPQVLRNLELNAKLNQGDDVVIRNLPGASMKDGVVEVCKLDWSNFDDDCPLFLDTTRKFDRIVGSDIICCTEDVESVCRVVSKLLARNASARCFFVVPSADHRWGAECFVPSLQQIGLDVFARPVLHSTHPNFQQGSGKVTCCWATEEVEEEDEVLLEGIEDISYFSWQIIHARWLSREGL